MLNMYKDRRHGWDECLALRAELDVYNACQSPYDQPCAAGLTPIMWWQRICPTEEPSKQVCSFAISLFSIVPHAADPERAFSQMGMIHTPMRNRFDADTVSDMTMVRQFYRQRDKLEER